MSNFRIAIPAMTPKHKVAEGQTQLDRTMTTPTRKRAHQLSSCPAGYLPGGCVVPLHLTVRQTAYRRHAVGVALFVYQLCAATRRFCRVNRLPWPSWQDLNKEFNAIKSDQFPFVTKVSAYPNNPAALRVMSAQSK